MYPYFACVIASTHMSYGFYVKQKQESQTAIAKVPTMVDTCKAVLVYMCLRAYGTARAWPR
jgi:hypothetical protein